MNYLSTEEIAKKWGVQQRQVQKLLAEERIQGAVKFGRVWMIPADAVKPSDPRGNMSSYDEKNLSADLARMLDTSHMPAPDGPLDEIMDAGDDNWTMYSECGLLYLQGDFERTKKLYNKTEGNDLARLQMASVAIGAAIGLGDYPFYTEIEDYLKKIIEKAEDERISAYAELALSTSYIGAFVPNMAPEWLKNGDFTHIYEGARAEASYRRSKYFQCIGDYASMLSVAQTALAFMDPLALSVYPGCYLKLVCALAYSHMGREEDAEKWLRETINSCFKYDFITPFAEVLPLFGGLVEELLIQEYPRYYDAVINLWKTTFANWTTFHNQFTKNNITQILTLREYEMALLVARGYSIKKIADKFNISVGRQKIIMHEIYGKLFITNRKELSENILTPQKP